MGYTGGGGGGGRTVVERGGSKDSENCDNLPMDNR